MILTRVLVILLLVAVMIEPLTVLANDKVKPFPPAETGYQRFVIELASLPHEENHQVELLIGKDMLVDCNRQFFSGDIQEQSLEGWGYTYYTIDKITGPASTLMACPPDEKKKHQFVSLRSKPSDLLTRYNSKLPIVIYVPLGFEVRYRLWRADDNTHHATPH